MSKFNLSEPRIIHILFVFIVKVHSLVIVND